MCDDNPSEWSRLLRLCFRRSLGASGAFVVPLFLRNSHKNFSRSTFRSVALFAIIASEEIRVVEESWIIPIISIVMCGTCCEVSAWEAFHMRSETLKTGSGRHLHKYWTYLFDAWVGLSNTVTVRIRKLPVNLFNIISKLKFATLIRFINQTDRYIDNPDLANNNKSAQFMRAYQTLSVLRAMENMIYDRHIMANLFYIAFRHSGSVSSVSK